VRTDDALGIALEALGEHETTPTEAPPTDRKRSECHTLHVAEVVSLRFLPADPKLAFAPAVELTLSELLAVLAIATGCTIRKGVDQHD
jgi:hypothetical protein